MSDSPSILLSEGARKNRQNSFDTEGEISIFDGEISFDTDSVTTKRSGDFLPPLEWMHLYPSARRMAASVFMYVMQGALGLEFPQASAKMTVRGRKIGRDFFVTKLTLNSIVPNEVPLRQGSIVEVQGRVGYDERNSEVRKSASDDSYRVPARADGSFELTEEEWMHLMPLFPGKRNVSKYEKKESP